MLIRKGGVLAGNDGYEVANIEYRKNVEGGKGEREIGC